MALARLSRGRHETSEGSAGCGILTVQGRMVSGVDAPALEVRKYGTREWVTKALREDVPMVDSYLQQRLRSLAVRDGWEVLSDTLIVQWRDRDSDPMAMVGLPDDDPLKIAWDKGELFMAYVTANVVPHPLAGAVLESGLV